LRDGGNGKGFEECELKSFVGDEREFYKIGNFVEKVGVARWMEGSCVTGALGSQAKAHQLPKREEQNENAEEGRHG